jgi:hypothetical protein
MGKGNVAMHLSYRHVSTRLIGLMNACAVRICASYPYLYSESWWTKVDVRAANH